MKFRETMTDWVVVALSPTLVGVLIASFVFYLSEVFYVGGFASRINFILAMFIMGAVCIGRLSIEEGNEYAAIYAAPLGLAASFAVFRFVDPAMAGIVLLGVIWFCAHKLTWDCTVIDNTKAAGGEGLLQTAGLDGPSDDTADADQLTGSASQLDLSATSGRGEAAPPSEEDESLASFWKRWGDNRRKHQAQGVWVVYFSAVALPIFGIGQWFIDGSDVARRAYCFRLLACFVACALCLLMTTSFLRIRRYLRQRQLEMPLQMAGAWVGSGLVLIVATILVCSVLPRRNPLMDITQDVPYFLRSPEDLESSQYAMMKSNGVQDDNNQAPAGQSSPGSQSGQYGGDAQARSGAQGQGGESRGGGRNAQGGQQGRGGQGGEQGQGGSGGKQSGGKQTGGKQGGGKQGGGKQGGGKQGGGKQGGGKQGEGNQGQGNQGQGDQGQGNQGQGNQGQGNQGQGNQGQGDQEQANQQGGPNGPNQQNGGAEGNQGSGEREGQRGAQRFGGNQNRSSQPNQASQNRNQSASNRNQSSPSPLSSMLGGMSAMLKLLYYLAIGAIVAFVVWKYWRQIREAVLKFIQSIRDLLDRLFGGKRREVERAAAEKAAADAGPPPRPFSDFPNPFSPGASERSANELVQHSFLAFEAWARERGVERHAEQTPIEFAASVARMENSVDDEARSLADLYCRLAYARQDLGREVLPPLQSLWSKMTVVAPPPAPPAAR